MIVPKMIVSGVVALGLIGGSVAFAGAAHAAPAHCGSGAGCAFQHTGFRGGWLGFQNSVSDYSKHSMGDFGPNADNQTSSFYNNGNKLRIAWYKDRNAGRAPYYLKLKQFDSNLHDGVGTPAGWQDVIGSSYFVK